MTSRLDEYADYHFAMYDAGDIDPTYPMLRYLVDRFELNTEQCYWLAYLYSLTYCGATVFYIYNEFPDFENVNLDRMTRWWTENKHNLVFQTDRRWIRSNDQFVPAVASYRNWIGNRTQERRFSLFNHPDPKVAYFRAYQSASEIYQMGRFALFLYLEAIHVVTGYKMIPHELDLRNSLSSRNGLVYALGEDALLRGHEYGDQPLPGPVYIVLKEELDNILSLLKALRPEARVDIWNVETTLCAYKKYKRGKQYIGYYINRQAKEIEAMQANVQDGVSWNVLWDFRASEFDQEYLEEMVKW